MPVIGGSGLFRFARGYAKLRTYWFSPSTRDAIVEYNVFVLHYYWYMCVDMHYYVYVYMRSYYWHAILCLRMTFILVLFLSHYGFVCINLSMNSKKKKIKYINLYIGEDKWEGFQSRPRINFKLWKNHNSFYLFGLFFIYKYFYEKLSKWLISFLFSAFETIIQAFTHLWC